MVRREIRKKYKKLYKSIVNDVLSEVKRMFNTEPDLYKTAWFLDYNWNALQLSIIYERKEITNYLFTLDPATFSSLCFHTDINLETALHTAAFKRNAKVFSL